MKRPKVIIIAQNQPIDNDAHFRRKMINALTRAERQSPRFPNLDLPAIQTVLGHRSLVSTFRYACYADDSAATRAAKLLDQVQLHGNRAMAGEG